MRGNQNYKNNKRGKRGGKYTHNRYNNNNYYQNNNKYDNYNNNYNYNDKNNQNNQYYNEEEYYEDSNNYNYNNQDGYYQDNQNDNNYNSSYNKKNYYNRGFKRYNEEQFGENNYKDKKKNKREYYNKLRKEKKEEEKKEEEKKEEEKEEEKKEEDVKENKEENEKEIPEQEEDEQTKEELNKINEEIKSNIEQHKQNIKEITKTELKKEENIFKRIIFSNEKIKSNPILIYNIMEIFKAKKSSDEMQGEFIDLLGFDDITTIEQFITNRDEIIESFEIAKTALDANNQKIKSGQENVKVFENTIIEPQIAKNKKKKGVMNEMQKVQIENNKILEFLGFEPNFISRNISKTENILEGNQIIEDEDIYQKKEIHPVKVIFGDVGYNEYVEKEKELYEEETQRKSTYTMVKVKAINKKRNKVEPLNVIKVLPKWAHRCFNFQFFNEIQSTVFDKSLNSDENLLITAPTGAGKTNIALVTIIREIEKELKLKNMNNIDEKFDFSKFK